MSDDFAPTRWSVVVAAGGRDPETTRAALETLCEAYWYPLYAWARRRGKRAADAEDLTQGFFAELLAKRWVEAADPSRGRFRAFLLTAFQRYVGHVRARDAAQKRGGDRTHLSLDFDDGERRYALEPSHVTTPERLYERRWALTVLERVLERLRRDEEAAGRGEAFVGLRGFLPGGADARSHREVAEALGTTEGALKVALHRLRTRYRERLRAEVAETVASQDDVDAELETLRRALMG